MKIKITKTACFGGFFVGIINGLLGAGGGIVAVPLLKKSGLSKKQAHANAVAMILPISVLSGILYIIRGDVALRDALPFIPSGLIGAVAGTYLLKKIPPKALKRIFALFIIYAGIRLLLK